MELFINSIKNKNIEDALEIYKTNDNINISVYNHYLLKTAFSMCNLNTIKFIMGVDKNIDLSMYNYKFLRNISIKINSKKIIKKKTMLYIIYNKRD